MKSRLAVGGLLLFALLLRLHGLADVPFWCDEAYTALTATHPEPIRSLLAIEHSPPLYYIGIMTPWSRLGESELWFRIPSVLAAIGVLLLGTRLARLLRGSPLLALVILAANAYLVTHSREARSYMAAAFFSFWAIVETVEIARSSARGAWLRYGVALLAACYIHYVQLAFGIATALTLILVRPSRRTFLGIAAITIAGLAAFLPWFSYLRTQLFEGTFYASVWSGASIGTWKDGPLYAYRLLAWSILYNVPPGLYGMLYTILPASIVAIVTWRLRRRFLAEIEVRTTALLIVILFVEAGLFWILRAVGEPVYLLALFPLLLTFLAVALSRDRHDDRLAGHRAILVVAILLAMSALGVNETWANRFHLEDRLTRDPWPDLRGHLITEAGPKAALVVIPGWPSPGGWYFRDHPHLYQVYLPTPYFRRVAPYEKLVVGDPIEIADRITAEHDEVWVLHFRPGHYPHDGAVIDQIERNLEPRSSVRIQELFGRMTLTRFDRDTASPADYP